ncbi:exonuclease [Mycobacterium phage Saguaro]|uniref:Exonuclease n=1 Tax=Mycobacterium phage Saguaro TaxID=2315616 RepID=A0A386KAG8_9CAUD|nr:exonuclease [Mycobacterium phage Saguaro]AYD82047.1 exonuclease [Mycobacterium phage Saguaro]
MSTVAQLYPPRRQPDGTVWYRAADDEGRLLDGWTSNLDYAHPSYYTSSAPEPIATTTKENTMQLTDDLEVAPRTTQWMGYPLPPATPRPQMKFNGWGWYQLPHPDTGRPTGYARATTIAKTLDDTTGLEKWKRRHTARRVLQLATTPPNEVIWGEYTAGELIERLLAAQDDSKATAPDEVLDLIDNCMGGADSRELGECVHAWLEALDMGIVLLRDVPDIVLPHVTAARAILAHRGLVALPQYVERVVLNDQGEETVAGQIDRIFRIVTTGELVLGDVKTSASLDYSWLPFGVQVGGCYGWATKMLTLDGKGWEPMPEIRRDFAILLHIPSNQPERGAAITIDLQWGAEAMVESLAVRQLRKDAKVAVPRHAIPAPTPEAIRYAEARNALSAIESLDEGQAVYESYADVWDDDLNAHATRVAELLS